MRNYFILLLISLISFSAFAAENNLAEFVLDFNQAQSNCDKLEFKKTSSDGKVFVSITLQDLAELGNLEFSTSIALKKFSFKNKSTVMAKRFAKFNGKRVKEVYSFKKNTAGNLVSVTLKRFKRSFVRYSYSLGGIICRIDTI